MADEDKNSSTHDVPVLTTYGVISLMVFIAAKRASDGQQAARNCLEGLFNTTLTKVAASLVDVRGILSDHKHLCMDSVLNGFCKHFRECESTWNQEATVCLKATQLMQVCGGFADHCPACFAARPHLIARFVVLTEEYWDEATYVGT